MLCPAFLYLQLEGFSRWWFCLLGSLAQAQVMRCMEFVVITACGIFPDEEVSLCPLPGQWILNHWMPREVPLPVCSVLVLIFVVGGFLG